jgi:hypothetical protein
MALHFFLRTLDSWYETLAARRYREYLLEKRRLMLNQILLAFALRLAAILVEMSQRSGLVKRRTVERISVE